jgi:hypothetical protein
LLLAIRHPARARKIIRQGSSHIPYHDGIDYRPDVSQILLGFSRVCNGKRTDR